MLKLVYLVSLFYIGFSQEQECTGTRSFTVTSKSYPDADGCYIYSGLNFFDGNVFKSSSDENDSIFESKSFVDETETRPVYYLKFGTDTEGEYGFCSSVSTSPSL